MWRMLLPCSKLIGLLLFCLLFLISILFFKPNIRTLLSRTELARLVMGIIFLVSHVYGSSRYIYIYNICTFVSNTHVRVECFAN